VMAAVRLTRAGVILISELASVGGRFGGSSQFPLERLTSGISLNMRPPMDPGPGPQGQPILLATGFWAAGGGIGYTMNVCTISPGFAGRLGRR
jgi:hypothetical protein